MTLFDNMEKAQEANYSNQLTREFKIQAKRNQLLGLWLAEKMGLSDADSHIYAKSVIDADFEEPGHEDVIRKLLTDIQKHNLEISEDQIRRKMAYYLDKAEDEFKNK